MNNNRKRNLMRNQKIRRTPTSVRLDSLPPLTQEQRKEIYAPRPATSAPKQLQAPEWVTAWKMIEKTTYGLTAISGLLFGGLLMGESKKSIKQ